MAESKNDCEIKVSCDYCGWDGVNFEGIGDFLVCPECQYPILTKFHILTPIVKQAQSAYRKEGKGMWK